MSIFIIMLNIYILILHIIIYTPKKMVCEHEILPSCKQNTT